MNDTSLKMRKKQLEIIHAKTSSERAMMGIDMIDSVKKIVTNSIKNRHPEYSELELKVAVFKRYYRNDFTPDQMEKIIQGMHRFHQSLPHNTTRRPLRDALPKI